jgi:putative Holliday junction resolvase
MKYLALDIGEVRVGVAVSDDSGIVATPLTFLHVGPKLMSELGELIQTEKPRVLVFGTPRHQNGEEGKMVPQIRAFAEVAKHEYNVEVEFEDESGTTLEAERRLAERKVSQDKYKELVDAEAAAVILESYLARK